MRCEACGGQGRRALASGRVAACPDCKGTGDVPRVQEPRPGIALPGGGRWMDPSGSSYDDHGGPVEPDLLLDEP